MTNDYPARLRLPGLRSATDRTNSAADPYHRLTMLAIAVLGPTELRRDGERIPVPSGKTTEVLIRLALDAGAVVRADRLIEDLWGAEADATERNTLQAKVSLLRRALGDATVLSGGRAGYSGSTRAPSTPSRCSRWPTPRKHSWKRARPGRRWPRACVP